MMLRPRLLPLTTLCFFLLAGTGCFAQDEAASSNLSLDRAYDLANSGSEEVRIKQLELAKSRLAAAEASSKALPQVNVKASASYLANPPVGVTVSRGSLGSFYLPSVGVLNLPQNDLVIEPNAENTYFQLSAALSQPLFTWGKIANAIQVARLEGDAAASELTIQRREIRRETNRAYFGVLLAQESEAILSRLSGRATDIVTDRQAAATQGTITKEAVLEAQATAASIASQLVDAEQSRLTSLESLSVLTGLDADSIAIADEWRAGLPALDEQALAAEAAAASGDLARAGTQMVQAQRQVAIAQGGEILHPDVSLNVSLDVDGQDIPIIGANWTDTWEWDLVVSLGIQMNLFDGFAASNRIREAKQDLAIAQTGVEEYQKLVRLNLRKAIDEAMKADARVRLDEASLAHSREQLRNAEASYEKGLSTREDYSKADLAYGSAQLDLLLQQFNREEAAADIEQLIGRRLAG